MHTYEYKNEMKLLKINLHIEQFIEKATNHMINCILLEFLLKTESYDFTYF